MLKTVKLVVTLIVVIVLLYSTKGYSQYELNRNYVGPTIGFSFLGSTLQVGINYEYSLQLENIGPIGVGGIFRYWGYSNKYLNGEWSYTDILIGAQGNYHFKTGNDKIDSWVGLTLAYDAGSVSWSGPHENYSTPAIGGLFLGAQGGLRYWISPKYALVARVGFGNLSYGSLEFGVDFIL